MYPSRAEARDEVDVEPRPLIRHDAEVDGAVLRDPRIRHLDPVELGEERLELAQEVDVAGHRNTVAAADGR